MSTVHDQDQERAACALTDPQLKQIASALWMNNDRLVHEQLCLRVVRAVPGMPELLPAAGALAQAAALAREHLCALALAIGHGRDADAAASRAHLHELLGITQPELSLP